MTELRSCLLTQLSGERMKRISILIAFLIGLLLYMNHPALADTGYVWGSVTGSGCAPEVGPTGAVDIDNDGVLDTFVVVYVLSGKAYIYSTNRTVLPLYDYTPP